MYPKKLTAAPIAPIAAASFFYTLDQFSKESDKGIKKDIADSGNPCLLKMPWVGLQKKLLLHQKTSLLEKYT